MIRNFTNVLKLIRSGGAFISVGHTRMNCGRTQAFCYLVDNSLPPETAYERAELFYTLTPLDFQSLENSCGDGYERAFALRPHDGSLRHHFFSNKCSTMTYLQLDVSFTYRAGDVISL